MVNPSGPRRRYRLGRRSADYLPELELDPPPCRYWSVHLNNWWLESPEFRDGQSVCINDAQAVRESDGTVNLNNSSNDFSGNRNCHCNNDYEKQRVGRICGSRPTKSWLQIHR